MPLLIIIFRYSHENWQTIFFHIFDYNIIIIISMEIMFIRVYTYTYFFTYEWLRPTTSHYTYSKMIMLITFYLNLLLQNNYLHKYKNMSTIHQ